MMGHSCPVLDTVELSVKKDDAQVETAAASLKFLSNEKAAASAAAMSMLAFAGPAHDPAAPSEDATMGREEARAAPPAAAAAASSSADPVVAADAAAAAAAAAVAAVAAVAAARPTPPVIPLQPPPLVPEMLEPPPLVQPESPGAYASFSFVSVYSS